MNDHWKVLYQVTVFYADRKSKMATTTTEKTKGRQIRSRVKWIEEGEKNTAYFLGLEKTRQTKMAKMNYMTKMVNLLLIKMR
jgi:hypothetical protein